MTKARGAPIPTPVPEPRTPAERLLSRLLKEGVVVPQRRYLLSTDQSARVFMWPEEDVLVGRLLTQNRYHDDLDDVEALQPRMAGWGGIQ